MISKDKLNALREEVEALNKKLKELTDEELAQVSGSAYIREYYDQVTQDLYYPGKNDNEKP